MIVAVDASTSIIGIAAGRDTVEHVRIVRCLDGDRSLQRTARERLWPALDEVAGVSSSVRLVVEEPPDAFRDDGSGRAKRQAVIGTRLGISIGLVLAWAHARSHVDGELLPNATWRAWATSQMRGDALRGPSSRTPPVAHPTARHPVVMPGGGWSISFEGCAHTWTASTLQQLTKRPSTCPTCAVAPTVDRNAHKAPFVDGARRRWPAVDAYVIERLAGAARDAHTLPGVADACDAAWMLGYVLSRP